MEALIRELSSQVEQLRREVREGAPRTSPSSEAHHDDRPPSPPTDHDQQRGPGVRALKVALPKFDGKADINRWVEKMESTSRLLGLTHDELASASWLTCLQGAALTMVETNEAARRNWEHQKAVLKKQFEDPMKDINTRNKIRSLRMKPPTI